MNEGKIAAKALIDSLKTSCPARSDLRKELVEAMNAITEKLQAMDRQMHTAPREFAKLNETDYQTYLNNLPDVGDPVLD